MAVKKIHKPTDQITVKCYYSTKQDAIKILKKIQKKIKGDEKYSESTLYALSIQRLEREANDVDWNNERQVNRFLEGLLNDTIDLKKSKKIPEKLRNRPQK